MKAREGYVYQRKMKDKETGAVRVLPTWWLGFGFQGRDIRESSGSSVRSDAVKLLQKRLQEIREGRFGINAEQVTFEQLQAVAIEKAQEDELRSLDRIERAFVNLASRLKNVPALWIPQRVPSYITARRKAGAKNATIKYELAILRRAFRVAVKRKLLPYRPDFDLPQVSNTRKNFITEEALKAIMAELPDYIAPVAEFCYLTSWRKSEATGLTWERVDWDAKTVRLDVGTTKNEEGREFPFGPFPRLEALLKARKAAAAAWELSHPGKKVDRVFWRPARDHAAPLTDFHETWRRACRNAGHEGAWLHDTRRSAVRNFRRAGISEADAMRLSGHKTAAMLKRYSIVAPKDLEDAVAKLAKVTGEAS